MISGPNLPTQASAQDLQARLLASTQSRARAASISENQATGARDANPDGIGRSSRSIACQTNPLANDNSTLALSPIEDNAQAFVATQHVRALIQAQPGAAMLAQANAHSQNVPRLLQ